MLLVSTDAVFIRISGTDPLSLVWMVSVFTLPVCWMLNQRLETLRLSTALRQQPVLICVLSALFASTQLCFLTAVQHTHIANVVAIVAAGPVFVALGARVFLGERTPARVWFAIGVTVVGILTIVSPSLGSANFQGDLYALLAIAGFSVSLLLLRQHPEMSRYLVFSASAALTLVVGLFWVDVFNQPQSAWLCAAAMGLFFNTGGRILYANAPRFAPSSEVALFNPVETVAATLWGWWFFLEIPSAQVIIGAVVVISGVVLGTVGRK